MKWLTQSECLDMSPDPVVLVQTLLWFKETHCVLQAHFLCDSQLDKHHENYVETSVKGPREDPHPALLVAMDTACRSVNGFMEMFSNSTRGEINQTRGGVFLFSVDKRWHDSRQRSARLQPDL